jgi:hypothetical protein
MRCCSMTVPTRRVFGSQKRGRALHLDRFGHLPDIQAETTRAVCCTCRSNADRVAVLKPGFSTFTSYVPGLSAGAVYYPSSFVTTLRIPFVLVLRMIIDAPATVAPVPSFTSPVMVPSV